VCHSYAQLAILRLITGVGGSLFVGCGFAMTSVWFRTRYTALALGISGGAAFSVGAAIGLFPWVNVVQSVGWHNALVIGGIIGVLIAVISLIFLRIPTGNEGLHGSRITAKSLKATLGSKDLWMLGLGILGGYGSYFTASQLLSEYVMTTNHFTAAQGGALSAVMVLAGIPGSVIGGWWSDVSGRRIPFLVYPIWVMAVALVCTVIAHGFLVWTVAFLIGFLLIFGFSSFTAIPSEYHYIRTEDIATAEGLMLTLAAVGGFLVPLGFGLIVNGSGYTAGWIFLGVVSVAFSLLNFLAKDPKKYSASDNVMRESVGHY
ncbi:MAG: MFS transporter, partial [Alicyclobacillus sp.]|nr:MFS transporter [Alicyclobacillus sp.]